MSETIKHEEHHDEYQDLSGNTVVTNETHSVTHKEVAVPASAFSLSRILGVIITILILAGIVALTISLLNKPKEAAPEPSVPDVSMIGSQPVPLPVSENRTIYGDSTNPLVAGTQQPPANSYAPVNTGASTTTISLLAGILAMGTVFFFRRRKSLAQS